MDHLNYSDEQSIIGAAASLFQAPQSDPVSASSPITQNLPVATRTSLDDQLYLAMAKAITVICDKKRVRPGLLSSGDYERMRTGSFVMIPDTKRIIGIVAATVLDHDGRGDFNIALIRHAEALSGQALLPLTTASQRTADPALEEKQPSPPSPSGGLKPSGISPPAP